jgi:hypothetical protein
MATESMEVDVLYKKEHRGRVGSVRLTSRIRSMERDRIGAEAESYGDALGALRAQISAGSVLMRIVRDNDAVSPVAQR